MILGIDPGYAAIGVALIEHDGSFRFVRGCTIRIAGDWLARANEFERHLFDLLPKAELVVIEDPTQAQVAQAKAGRFNLGASRVTRMTGLAEGMARAAGVRSATVQPVQWRRAVGLPGRASKGQTKVWMSTVVESVPERISEHLADAIGIAVGGSIVARGRMVA